jgi:hypothetical protein
MRLRAVVGWLCAVGGVVAGFSACGIRLTGGRHDGWLTVIAIGLLLAARELLGLAHQEAK